MFSRAIYHPDRPGLTRYGVWVMRWREFKKALQTCDGCGRVGRRKRCIVLSDKKRVYCDWQCQHGRQRR